LLRVRPQIQSLCRFGSPSAREHEAGHGSSAPFHIVTSGACVIELTELDRSIALQAGDVAVLPGGPRHTVAGNAQLIRGRLNFEASNSLLLAALPDAIVVTTSDGTDAGRMSELITAIQCELEAARPGAWAITNDLASVLFLMVLRAHLEREHAGNGLLRLLSHRQAGRAAGAMLQDPARAWTLDELAERANASRASLVRMFKKTVNLPPLELLAQLRLDLARRKLAATSRPLAQIAAEIGYQSESAFSRAFRRRFGIRPGEARLGRARGSPDVICSVPGAGPKYSRDAVVAN
jgi:AraC family transcriptional activator of mtrCDE